MACTVNKNGRQQSYRKEPPVGRTGMQSALYHEVLDLWEVPSSI